MKKDKELIRKEKQEHWAGECEQAQEKSQPAAREGRKRSNTHAIPRLVHTMHDG